MQKVYDDPTSNLDKIINRARSHTFIVQTEELEITSEQKEAEQNEYLIKPADYSENRL